jgi:acylphosphatase
MSEELVRFFGRAAGHVQGVGFRFFVQQNAKKLGITGWIRNMEDSTVTMELQGTTEKIEALTKLIKAGNYFIKVKSFALEDREIAADEKNFKIRY